MTARPAAAALAALALGLGLAGGCPSRPPVPPGPPESAEEAARALFWLAAEEQPRPEEVERIVDPEAARRDPAALADALDALRRANGIGIARSEELPGIGRVALEVDGDLAGGGQARFEVQAAPLADGTWRVLWFGGPGVEWPPQPVPGSEGLSFSTPPERGADER